MSASNRELGIGKTLTYEGGFTNNPHDPGGATNYGITIHDARLYWKPDATPEDVRNMPREVAIEIYRQKYWAKMGCDDRPSGPDVFEFDTGVNSGVGRVAQWRKVIDQNLSPVEYVKAFSAKRSSFLHSLKTWQFFGKGWGRRVADLEAFCVRLALGDKAAPALRKEAVKHAKKAMAHTGAATAAPVIMHHAVNLHTLAGCAIAAAVVFGVMYDLWHAIHAKHRADAYTEQLKQV